ncbi:SPOR domain-containing protein [Lutimonas zeaxanthinifaciens]|uniref:SPOR domain-containing protein n=1 Tax=Lutimonas zeaxanthinifaciens TaxID=3060215 RepID=UPI00265CF842|nr:SPOR domain-containing protein [Lutimonas sp. YSD2104]WKK65691.1 SPOR domain-containing protein [Lutimonas sp. YSD2104]
MKKLMIMMLAAVPFGMIAQGVQGVDESANDIFNSSYAELEIATNDNPFKEKDSPDLNMYEDNSSEYETYEVNDLLLADPNFDIQEDMIAYTKDLKTVYFSANKKLKAKKGNTSDVKIKKSVQLKLFKANVKENGEWENLEMLPVNGKRNSTGYPSLNNDDTKLYFVADGPQSTGKTDIFVVDLLEDGTYGNAENMGSKINSEEREMQPLLDESNVLYFTSDIDTDGEELDVFASVVNEDEPSTPIKLNVSATGSKEDYVAAFKAVEEEAIRLAEEEANLRDLEILLEAENLAEIAQVEEDFKNTLSGKAYDFGGDQIIYTVQIGAFLQNVKTGTYKKSAGLFNHRYDDGYNRFYSGVFNTYEEALDHLKQMRKDRYEDAFVLGLEGTKRFLPK